MQGLLEMQSTFLIRILLACVCGIVIGVERQKRTKSAGVRTHLMIAIASALMMIVSKYGFLDIVGGTPGISVDVSRVAAGIITGLGIFGGVIYMGKRGNATGVTTIAGVWVTVGLGMACGAGMYLLAIETTVIVLCFQFILHSNLWIARHNTKYQVVFRLKDGMKEYEEIEKKMLEYKVEFWRVKWECKGNGEIELSCIAELNVRTNPSEVTAALLEMPQLVKIETL
ncbi:MAG: MgtC/SapB family protein [Acetatifactor sp.]|nr:MgtC/SapB family protein [Acetatifactor sp.]